MGSDTPELGLDLKLCATKAAAALVSPAAERRDAALEAALLGLEVERAKIEAFKRELPLSIRLVADVIGILRDELEQCRSDERCGVLEEFMPVGSNKSEEKGEVKVEMDSKDNKMNWMSSAQLWSSNHHTAAPNNPTGGKKSMQEETEAIEPKGGCGAFVPFKSVLGARREEKPVAALPDLSLLSSKPSIDDIRYGGASCKLRAPVNCSIGGQLSLQAQQQQAAAAAAARKARRCWSPELHRRFVLALQQLGGAQVATPKQIRELMKVDGLTNDEVKSHLQKYRLHTRRVPNGSSQPSRPVVMVGNLWVPQQEHYSSSSKQSASKSGSPQGPLQLVSSSRAVSVTAGDSCEEDGKSESCSWK